MVQLEGSAVVWVISIAYTSFERFWADTSFKLSSEDLVWQGNQDWDVASIGEYVSRICYKYTK